MMLFLFWFVFVKICCLLVLWAVNKVLHQKIRLSFFIVLTLRWAIVRSSACVWYQILLVYIHLHLVLLSSAVKSVPRPPACEGHPHLQLFVLRDFALSRGCCVSPPAQSWITASLDHFPKCLTRSLRCIV